jgi:hypothetical protein
MGLTGDISFPFWFSETPLPIVHFFTGLRPLSLSQIGLLAIHFLANAFAHLVCYVQQSL